MRREMRSVLLSVVVVSLVLVIGFQHAYGEITLTFGLWDENQKPTMQKIVDAFNARMKG